MNDSSSGLLWTTLRILDLGDTRHKAEIRQDLAVLVRDLPDQPHPFAVPHHRCASQLLHRMVVRYPLEKRHPVEGFPETVCHDHGQEIDEFRPDDRPVIVDLGLIEHQDVLVEPEHDLDVPSLLVGFVGGLRFHIHIGHEHDGTELLAEFVQFMRIVIIVFGDPCALLLGRPLGVLVGVQELPVVHAFLPGCQPLLVRNIGIIVVHPVFRDAVSIAFEGYQEMKVRTGIEGLLRGGIAELLVRYDDPPVHVVGLDEIAQCRDVHGVPGIRFAAYGFPRLDIEGVDDRDVPGPFLQGLPGMV